MNKEYTPKDLEEMAQHYWLRKIEHRLEELNVGLVVMTLVHILLAILIIILN